MVRNSNLTHEKWRQLYPKAEFTIIAHNTLSRTGIIDYQEALKNATAFISHGVFLCFAE
ncbi:hypothetical protein C2W64_02560 [Brevibacillus laterosporus]|nr:hypothetical protein C2W64_02560 [Brevibacillus laterosporus]